MEIDQDRMVQFPALGLVMPEEHPDGNKYVSIELRKRQVNSSDVAEITLMSPGDILLLHSDGVYDGSDEQDRLQIQRVIREHKNEPAREICDAILKHAVQQDEYLQQIGEPDRIDDKTVFVIKRR